MILRQKTTCFNALLTVLLILFSGTINVFGENNSVNEDHNSEFNVNELIMHHIKDSHSWHLWTTTDNDGSVHHVAIPLPVILYYQGQLDIFMSSEFHHGHTPVIRGNRTYVLDHEKIYVTADETFTEGSELEEMPLDFSITRNVASMFIDVIILLIIFISVAKFYKRNPNQAPRGLAGFLEPIILFVRDEIAIPNIGKRDSERFISYLLTVFFFILLNNILGLIPLFPGASNVTGNISVTLVLALFTMIITNINGSKDYWRHIFAPPGVPVFVLPVLIVVELIGIITKPFALMVRLFANITAGHIIILSLVSLIFILQSYFIAPVSILFVLFMNLLEIMVAFLQAYIFTMLSALFIGLAVQKHH